MTGPRPLASKRQLPQRRWREKAGRAQDRVPSLQFGSLAKRRSQQQDGGVGEVVSEASSSRWAAGHRVKAEVSSLAVSHHFGVTGEEGTGCRGQWGGKARMWTWHMK